MRDEFGGAQPECVSRSALRAACAAVQASQDAWTGPTLTTSAGYGFDPMVDNPWTSLPTAAPFVLDEDRSVVEGQSNLAPGLAMPPVPYLGSPDHAELVLLNLNPGFRDEHVEFMRHAQYDEYVEQNRLGLSFNSRVPFWSLDDTVDAAPGYRSALSVTQVQGPRPARAVATIRVSARARAACSGKAGRCDASLGAMEQSDPRARGARAPIRPRAAAERCRLASEHATWRVRRPNPAPHQVARIPRACPRLRGIKGWSLPSERVIEEIGAAAAARRAPAVVLVDHPGRRQRRSGNRAKSRSSEMSSQPCSSAIAAM